MTRDPQCEAVVHVKNRGSHRCPFAGKHTHHIPSGKIHLCGNHLTALLRRENDGSPEDMLAGWGRA